MPETELQTALRARLVRNGRRGRPHSCSDEQIEAALRRYANNESASAVARDLGVSKNTVLRWARKVARDGSIA